MKRNEHLAHTFLRAFSAARETSLIPPPHADLETCRWRICCSNSTKSDQEIDYQFQLAKLRVHTGSVYITKVVS
jgi:hypothetical protein